MKIASSIAESPPPTTTHLLALEEGAVADAAGRDPAAAELDLAGDAEPLRLGAHRQDHRLRQVLLVAEEDLLQPAVAELDPVASSVTKRVPKRSAWSRNCCIISGPMIPSG